MNAKSRKTIWLTLAGVVFILAAVAIAVNFSYLKDVFVGMQYQPSTEMSEIRDKLRLTGKGAVIFNASSPELKERDEFNAYCREAENTEAVLGCYTNDRIYIYNIVNNELSGIKELTAAHELLHAVYDRMAAKEREKWGELLTGVYAANKDVLGEEIEMYAGDQRAEELYVRAGTEVRELPEELEKHYAEIFEDQDAVVGYYDSYIGVFNGVKKRLSEILAQVDALRSEVDAKTAAYEAGVAELNGQISEFNQCARTADCFSSSWAFTSRRNELMGRQAELEALYNEINGLIEEYNGLVAEYNENVLHGQILNQAINSSAAVEGI